MATTFTYTARTSAGLLTHGTIDAASTQEAAAQLTSRGLSGVALRKKKSTKRGFFLSLGRISAVQKIFFTQNLTVMIRAGFSLGVALETLVRQMDHPKMKSVTESLWHDVESGTSFADALRKHPKVFDDIFISMIAAGEQSGKLDEVLVRLTQQMRKQHELTTKIRNALTYPIIVVVAMLAMAIGVVVFLIPRITSLYTESGASLPLPTQILISISTFLIQRGIWVSIAVVLLGFGFTKALQTPRGKKIFHAMFLRTPIMGSIMRKINLARFTRTLASLLKTDIPIVTTFQIIAQILPNIYYKEAILDASRKLKDGVSIVVSLEEQEKLFPPIVTQILGVGEQSGTLDTVAEDIASFYEEDVDATMGNLSTLIEPILILLLGVGVALLAISVLLPIYSLSETIT